MHSEEFIQSMMEEIHQYVSNEVNWIEACVQYMEKHDVDAETFSAIASKNPRLISEITSAARKLKVVNLDYATIF